MKNVSLPDKMSDLIEVALNDLEKVEQDPKYEVNMTYWHEPREGLGTCSVCLAGSVIAKTFEADPRLDLVPCDIGEDDLNHAKLSALDDIRAGAFEYAAHKMGLPDIDDSLQAKLNRGFVSYHEDWQGFKVWLRDVVVKLRNRGL